MTTTAIPIDELIEETPHRWRLERRGDMRVPGIVFASRALLPELAEDRSLQQVANVATLPGIVGASFAMPDVHWGYGFPIGGVAATDVANGGVVSPGGVGFDISCGVRLLITSLHRDELGGRLTTLMDRLGRAIPRGAGPGGLWEVDPEELESVLRGGARYAVNQGHGRPEDLARCEDAGVVGGVDTAHVSARARRRGARQIGSLGSGNHFLEVQVVDQIFDADHADAFGLAPGMIVVMIHTGSRGLGHQVCSDHVDTMTAAMPSYGIEVPDRQLVCAPVHSAHGRAYMGAMAASANFGRANRQLLTEAARHEFEAVFGGVSVDLLWDVSHNLAKLENHLVDGEERELCVHRKGATLALPPGHPDLPDDLRPWGQPALIPGSMGTASYVLAGVEGGTAFHSTCHGAGRRMSRHAARRKIHGGELRDQLEAEGIAVRGAGMRGLAEEAPFAYKDVDEVVDVCEQAGLARRVARMRPLGVVKG